MSIFQCFVIGLISVFVILDSRILGRLNFERPLISCTLVGLFLGDLKTGLAVGAQMEMVTLGMMSIGASGVNMNMGSIVGCALVISTGADVEMALTVAVPMTLLNSLLGTLGSVIRIQFTHIIDGYVEKENYKMALQVHRVWGPILYSLFAFIPVFLVLIIGADAVQAIVDTIPTWLSKGVSLGANLICFYGFSLLLTTMINKKNAIYFFIGFAVAAYSGLGLTAMSIIAILVAVLLYQIRYQDQPAVAAANSGIDDLEDLDN